MTDISDKIDLIKLVAIPGRAEPTKTQPQKESDDKSSRPLTATPFKWRDPASIPQRKFIYGKHYSRGFISAKAAPGGVGKSVLALTELIAICTGKPLLGIQPEESVRCWYWNGEDPIDEIERRVHAICKHYDIGALEIENRLSSTLDV